MKKQKVIQKKFISLKEASSISGYAPDYLGFLIRRKKIIGKKIYSGSKWLVFKKDFFNYLAKKKKKFPKPLQKSFFNFHHYITLKEASQISGYTPDHIGYLIRKRKVRGKQVFYGVKWLTTKEAIEDYLRLKKKKKSAFGILSFYLEKIFEKIVVLFFKTTKYVSLSFFLSFIVFSGLIVWAFVSLNSPQTIKIFPQNVSGDWEKIENAIGPADVGEEGEITHFSEKNSAVYSGGGKILIVENFNQTDTNQKEKKDLIEEATSTEENYLETQDSTSLFEKFKNHLQKNIAKAQGNSSFEDLKKKEFLSVKIKFSFALGERPIDFYLEEKEPEIKKEEGGWLKNFRFSFFKNFVLAQEGENELKGESTNTTTEEIINENSEKGVENLTPTSTKESIENLISTSTETTSEELINEIEDMSAKEIIQNSISTSSETTTEEISTSTIPETVTPESDLKIIVWYSLDGENWEVLKKFSENEISNFLNDGYFTFEAPFLKSWEDLEKLKIKFEGVVGGQTNFVAFLDSIWLEVNYKEKEKTEYEIEVLKKDWQAKENPTFIVKPKFEETEKEFPETLLGEVSKIFETKPKVKVRLEKFGENEKELKEDEDFISETHSPTKIQILRPKDFKPGIFKIKIDFEKEGEILAFEEEFSWGLVAINFNKSVYTISDESVFFQMSVLDNNGHTVCDAQLEMKILDPEGKETIFSTADQTIKYSGQCGPNNVVDIPDYFVFYDLSEKPIGIYNVELIAKTKDGERKITDSFEMRESVPFDIERIGPTRIWPPAKYGMKIKIKANEDFEGEIVEKIPASFEIIQDTKYEIQTPRYEIRDTNPEIKEIVWKTSLKENEEIELSYQFDAPDISPYLYLLGPLTLNNQKVILNSQFQEKRHWQIASDAVGARAKTIQFFAGMYPGNGAGGQNSNTNLSLDIQNLKLGEKGVNIKNAFLVLEAQLNGSGDRGNTTGHILAFDACLDPCTPDPWTGSGRVEQNQGTTVLQYQDTDGGHYVRLLMNVSSETELASYSGSSQTLNFRVGYRFNNGATALTIDSVKAKLFLTYTFDESSETITNTVIYPLESTYSGDQGSRTQSQASGCTRNSNCPTFNYKVEIPEFSQKVSQWFEIGGFNDGNAGTDVQRNVNIQGTDLDSSTFYLEAAQGGGQGNWSEGWWTGVSGFQENATQTLEHWHLNGTQYLIGGEVFETYLASSTAQVKTKTVSSPIGVITNDASTGINYTASTTVYFPEAGVTIKKAWLRIIAVGDDASGAHTISVSTKVGNNATSSSIIYNQNPPGTIITQFSKIYHLIPQSDYQELSLASATSGKVVSVTVNASDAEVDGISAELMITYTYTDDNSGYLNTIYLFAGQANNAGNSQSYTQNNVFSSVIPEPVGTTTIRAAALRASYSCSDSDNAMPTSDAFLAGANISTSTPSCSNTFTSALDGANAFFDYYQLVTSQMNTQNNQSYNVCYTNNGDGDTSTGAKMNGYLIYTYQIDIPKITFTQSNWRWYENADSLSPGNPIANENATGTVFEGEVYRLRINVLVQDYPLATSTQSFRLQYGTSTQGCDQISEWKDVGKIGSSEAIRGYDNSEVPDGTTTNSLLLSNSNVYGTYEEENPSALNPYYVSQNQRVEFDWVIEFYNIPSGLNFCFRLVKSDGKVLDNYYSYPVVYKIAVPSAPFLYNEDTQNQQQVAFNNIRQSTTTPTFRVSANYEGGNFDRFQLELNTASDFSGTAYTQTFSGTFASGTIYNLLADNLSPPLPTTDGATYYVRVRASADGGQNWGNWSTENHPVWTFTYKTQVELPDWFQTTNEQFTLGTLTHTIATSNSVILDPSYQPEIIATSSYTLQTSGSANWSHTYYLPENVDLVLFTLHNRNATVQSISFGGVTPTLLASAASSWPQTYIYAIARDNLPNSGQQTLSVTWSGANTGASSFVALRNIHPDVLQDLGEIATAVTDDNNSSLSITTNITTPRNNCLVLDAITIRDALTASAGSGQTVLFSEIFDSPRRAASSYKKVEEATTTSMSWSWSGTANRRRHVVTAIPLADKTGTILSPEIDFDWVPNQTNWGEIKFSTNENYGDIKLQVYYAPTSSCNTLIPNNALPGNAVGFDVTESPIDISGLNPTTYNRICLKANLRSDYNTPYLLDWTVSWVPSMVSVNIFGYVFQSDRTTTSTLGSIVHLVINGSSTATTTASIQTGEYRFSKIPKNILSTSTPITVFLEDDLESGSTITRYDGQSQNVFLNIFDKHVALRHEDSGPITNCDIGHYDSDNNSFVPYQVSSAPNCNLNVTSTHTLLVLSSFTFEPTNNVSTPYLEIENGATLNGKNSEITIRGGGTPFIVKGNFNSASSTLKYIGPELISTSTTILRPNANGTTNQWSVFPAGTQQWDAVDDVTPDGDTTYIYSSTIGQISLFNLPNNLIPSGSIINKITIYAVARSTGATTRYFNIGLRTQGQNYWGPDIFPPTTYTQYSQTWTTNPFTGERWTVEDINNLEVGVRNNSTVGGRQINVTQIFVEVEYISPVYITATQYWNLKLEPPAGVYYVMGTQNGQTMTVNNNFDAGGTSTTKIYANVYNLNLQVSKNLTISTTTQFFAPKSGFDFKVGGNFTNYGTFSHSSSTLILNGNSQQTISGNLTATSSFYNLRIENTFGSVEGCATSFSPGIIFATSTQVSNYFYIETAPLPGSVFVQFNSSSTYNFANIQWVGTSQKPIYFRNSDLQNGHWHLIVPEGGYQEVSYVNVARSDASQGATIQAGNGTNTNCGNNINWSFFVISGFVFSDRGMTTSTLGSEIAIAVNGSPIATTTASTSTGQYIFDNIDSGILFSGAPITVFINGGTESGAVITLYDSGSITDLNIYNGYIILRHENSGPITNQDIGHFDGDENPNIPYSVTTGPIYNLNVNNNHTLLVLSSYKFEPTWNVSTPALIVENGATLNALTSTISLRGTGNPFQIESGANFNVGSSTISFEATSSTTTIPVLTYYNLQTNPETGTPNFVFATGTITINNNFLATTTNNAQATINANLNDPQITVNNNFVLSSGQTFQASNSSRLKIAGNFENRGNFVHNSGIVEFINSSKETQILGATTFYNFYSTTSNKTLKFEPGTDSTTTIEGGFYLSGGSCNTTIKLRSLNSPNQWYIQAASSSLEYIDVQDSYAINPLTANNSYNSGNNTNWTILLGVCLPPGINIGGTVYVDEGTTTVTTTLTVKLAIDGNFVATTTVSSSTGEYLFTINYDDPLAPTTSDPITVFISEGDSGASITIYGGSEDILDLDIYLKRVITRHHYGSFINNQKIGHYTTGTPYTVSSGPYYQLEVNPGHKILGWQGNTFKPEGNVLTPAIAIKGTFQPESNYLVLKDYGQDSDCSKGAGTVMPLCIFATGNIQTASSTISFEATLATTTLNAITYYNLQTNPESGTPFFVFATGTITINNNFLATTTNNAQATINANLNDPQITVNNHFVLSSSQTFQASDSSRLKIAGNFENRGNFIHNSGTVEFINSSKETQILGSTTFYNFYATTSNKTIKFEQGTNSTTTISGVFYINGGACETTVKLLSLNSPNQWYLQVASSSINFASIKDSYAINSITANNSYDLGNNVNWTILTGSCTPPTEISGKVFIDEGNTTTTASLTVYLAINGNLIDNTQTSNGQYSFVFPYGDPSAPTTSDPITVFLDSQNATGASVTIYGSGSITDLDIYYNRVILRHQYGSSINNSQIGHYSSTTLPFSVESGELIVKSGNKILIWQGNTFQPQGNVKTPAISIKGNFKPEGNTISLTAGGENTNCSLEAGTVMPICLATGGSFDSGTSTVSFEGQATTAIATLYYYNLKTNASSTVTYYFRSGTIIISNDLTLFNNNGQVTLRADLQNPSLTIGGNLTIEQNQTFVASASGSFYVAKSFSNQGNFVHNQGTITFNGNQAGQTIDPGQNSFYNIRFNGSGSWTFLATTTVENDFEILQGTVTAPSTTLEIARNFRNDGTFNHNNGKVVFYSSSTESQILGPATFYNFSCETPSKILKFEPGSTNQITILNSLYLKPSPSDCANPIYLRSMADDQRWYIDAQGTTTLDYLYVKDSYAVTPLVAYNSINARNNVNWSFYPGECAIAIEISGYVFKQDRITTSTDQSIVRLAIDGQYVTSTVANSNGFYQFPNAPIILIPGIPVTVWIDDDLESGATIIRYQGEGNILGLDLYDKTITLRHGDSGPIDNFDVGHYQTSTIPFDVTEEGELSVNSGHRIFVYQNTNYNPRGNIKTPAIVLRGNLNLENYTLSLFGAGESSNCSDNVGVTMPICVISGGNLNYGSSTISFEATEGTSTVAAISYYNLQTNPATGTPVFVFQSGNITIYNNFLSTTTDSAQATISANLQDPQITINGNFINSQNQNFESSDSSKLKVAGNWKNEGNFVHNNGTVEFISNQSGKEIDNGQSTFGNLDFNGQGSWYFATSTTLDGSLRMVQGELYGESDITIKGGNLDCGLTCGNINLTGGTLYLQGTGNLGTSGLIVQWFFINFVLGDGENISTTTSRFAQGSVFDVLGNFEIKNYHNFVAPQSGVEFFIGGNYTNLGRFFHNNGELIIGGSTQQILSGNLNGDSAFYNLSLENTSGSGDPFEPGIIFATSCKANLLKINGFGTKVQFEANALFEFNYINWKGASSTDMIYFRSSQTGNWWWLDVEHPTPVSFVNVQDSNATYTYPYIDATNGTNYDAGDNVNWIFEAITISGRVFIDEGQTTTSQPLIVRLVINTDYYNATTVVSTSTGIYEFKNVPKNLATSTPMTVYVENATSGATITRHNGLGQDITDLDIYLQRVIVRHHDSGSITNQDIGHYTTGTPYSVNPGPPFSLTVNPGYKLLVWQGSSFRSEGPVETPALTIYGTFEPENYFVTLTASGQNQDCSQAAGTVIPLCLGGSGQFIVASSTVSFEGTATSSVLAMTYYNLQFEPPTGGYFEFLGNATATNNFSILAGTVSTPSILTVGGNWQNQGIFLHNSGDVILNSSSSVTLSAGGENGKFWNLTFQNSSGTWTLGSDLVIENVLNLQSGILNGATSTISLRGSGDPFVVSGTFESASSTVSFEGTGTTTSIPLLVYWNLQTNPSTGTPQFTPETGELHINNNLSVLRGIFNLAGTTTIEQDILVGNEGNLSLNNQNLIVNGGDIQTQGTGEISCSACSQGTVYLSGTGQIGGGTGEITFYNFNATGTGTTNLASSITLINNLQINQGRTFDVSTSNYQITVGGSWQNSGIFLRRQGTVLFNATTTEKTISDGGWPFWNLVFNGEGGSWLYKDSGTSTPPNSTQVQAGEATFLNAKTGTTTVSGGELNVDWYLGIHLVDKDTPSHNIANASTTIIEVTGSSTVWKMSGGDWGTPSSSQTSLTGSDGKTPQPNSDGAIRIREYKKTASATSYYKYNLTIPPVPGFHDYDWYQDGYGGYITSVFSPESGVEKVIGENWHRINISQMNTPYPGINQPPNNGSWYAGMTSDFEFSVDSLSVNLGNLNELNIWTATGTNLLSATTSYPEGYTIKSYAIYDGELRYYEGGNLIDAISRWPYPNSNPASWSGNCDQNNQCGFGYTTSALLGPNCDDNRFATSTKYAGFATSSEQTDEVAKSCQAVYGHQTTIGYKVSAPRMKVPGTYEGTIYYIGFVNY